MSRKQKEKAKSQPAVLQSKHFFIRIPTSEDSSRNFRWSTSATCLYWPSLPLFLTGMIYPSLIECLCPRGNRVLNEALNMTQDKLESANYAIFLCQSFTWHTDTKSSITKLWVCIKKAAKNVAFYYWGYLFLHIIVFGSKLCGFLYIFLNPS